MTQVVSRQHLPALAGLPVQAQLILSAAVNTFAAELEADLTHACVVELASDLAEATELRLARGLGPDEAAHGALADFGDLRGPAREVARIGRSARRRRGLRALALAVPLFVWWISLFRLSGAEPWAEHSEPLLTEVAGTVATLATIGALCAAAAGFLATLVPGAATGATRVLSASPLLLLATSTGSLMTYTAAREQLAPRSMDADAVAAAVLFAGAAGLAAIRRHRSGDAIGTPVMGGRA